MLHWDSKANGMLSDYKFKLNFGICIIYLFFLPYLLKREIKKGF